MLKINIRSCPMVYGIYCISGFCTTDTSVLFVCDFGQFSKVCLAFIKTVDLILYVSLGML